MTGIDGIDLPHDTERSSEPVRAETTVLAKRSHSQSVRNVELEVEEGSSARGLDEGECAESYEYFTKAEAASEAIVVLRSVKLPDW